MTKDLTIIVTGNYNPPRDTWCTTQEFIDEVEKRIKSFYSS